MKHISVGDTVKLIFTDEIGIVQRWQDAETVLVKVGKVEFPVFVEFLEKIDTTKPNKDPQKGVLLPPPPKAAIVVQPNTAKVIEKIKAMGIQSPPDEFPDKGITVALQPFYHQDLTVAYFLVHLINNSGKPLQFDYTMYLNEEEKFNFSKPIGGRDAMILNSIDADQLNDKPELVFKFTHLSQPLDKRYIAQFEHTLMPKARMLRHDPIETPKINGRAYLHIIEHTLPQTTPPAHQAKTHAPKPIDPIHLQQQLVSPKIPEHTPKPDTERLEINAHIREIDLHIEALLTAYKHLPKNEILRVQIKHFERSLDEAIKRRELSMIVIHGLGKGKLREEVMRLLREYKEVAHFKNEYHPKYGFGATEIVFEY
ncbi:MAG: Smr/MutS family protein [Chitinophagales bacterium]|nr:Smr/MutS family protein [Chitinophagales bacterium]